MLWRVDVSTKGGGVDPAAREIGAVRAIQIYLVEGELDRAAAERIARDLLHDPVTQSFSVFPASEPPTIPDDVRAILVFKRPGVMDPVEQSALKAIADAGLSATRVRTGRRYEVRGGDGNGRLREAAAGAVANEAIDEIIVGERPFERIDLGSEYPFSLVRVPILEVADDALLTLSRKRGLHFTLREFHAVRDHFRAAGREPTDVELETIAQTWSEHCKHKTFTGDIHTSDGTISNLLKSTIGRVTSELDLPWCVSVFKDNAGIIEFDDKNNVCFKAETHNHPSAIEPYGGSNTGMGGVIRDILGCGLGARPVCSTDVFCVGLPDAEEIPPGTVHPRRLLHGVVSGVRDYGNRMGIPTVNGAVFFDERYVGNPLVFCGTVGILPKEMSFKEVKQDDLVVVVGGRTGRDGIHGATFSSVELDETSESASSGAVQIGNAIVEKRVLDTTLQARDRGLYRGITDCGAGGLSSAVGEMGEKTGAEVDLDTVPLKYEGLTYSEIWISEAQERMVLAVPPEKRDELLAVYRAEDVEATVIGRFTDDGRLKLRYGGEVVADLEMKFLHDGLPKFESEARWVPAEAKAPELSSKPSYGEDLKKILSSWNVCSKEWIIRQYDHEVQAGSVIKPLVGADHDGPGDAAVIRPVLDHYKGLAVGCGMNPRLGDLSPYQMAAHAIDEAMRNVVAVGGDPGRTALLDNFSWGNPDIPETLGALVEACRACYDVAKVYGTPYISGKDSLNNEFRAGGRTITIPHSLLISAISIVGDVRKCVTMDAKEAGNLIYLAGAVVPGMGGSHYHFVNGLSGGRVPPVEPSAGRKVFAAMAQVSRDGRVRSCHDLSEGGLAVAAAEMAFAGGLGMQLDAGRDPQSLFSEAPSRFLVEVEPGNRAGFEKAVSATAIGEVTSGDRLVISGVIDESIVDLKDAWKEPLRW